MTTPRTYTPPEIECRGGCGRRRRTWTSSWLCRFCLLDERAASPESFRATRRRFAGQCVVCGLSPCGCEFGPKVGMDTDWLDEGTDRSRDEWEDAQERREDYARDQRESDEREAGVRLGR